MREIFKALQNPQSRTFANASPCELSTTARMSFINLTAPGASSCIASTCAPSRTFRRIRVRTHTYTCFYIYESPATGAGCLRTLARVS